ncbi:alpha/beta hydrolase [Hymenobacter sp. YC55]|uniref:alpha/beta fold hydrolase n=1 Tax=Hymenobacter sp. YC55 TaxID=3034019 RepID=UPI0023F7AE84|nr:alpha/beta hydrolase [Hymenobacter sp. YC55]MDF7815190.1 alpha/beta hydrolase [Hymenobacter sp. YC55]
MLAPSFSSPSAPVSLDTPAVAAEAAANQTLLRRHHVRVLGEGKPAMVLCNGFGCSQQIWRHMIPTLAARYQLILFDYVGSGESDLSAYDERKYATLAGYAQDVVDICQALQLHDAVIVGHSVGAMIGLLAATQAPRYFTKLVLIAPSPYYLNEPDYYGGFEVDDVHQLLALMDEDYHSWTNLFASLLMGPANPASLGEELATYFCQTDSAIAQQFARVVFLSDNRPDLARLRQPALVLQCQQDVAAPAEVGAYLARHLPVATLVTLNATGHCPHLSAPLETLRAMEAFLA